jgi:hypothetical protein
MCAPVGTVRSDFAVRIQQRAAFRICGSLCFVLYVKAVVAVMKMCIIVVLTMLLAGAGAGAADKTSPAPEAPPATTKPRIRTDKEIKAFQTRWMDPLTQEKAVFRASLKLKTLTDEEKKKYLKSKKIPVMLKAALHLYKRIQGTKIEEKSYDTGHFYILDPDGKEIARKSMPLSLLSTC